MSEKTNKEIVKPITVAREDFKNELLELCNNSNLPLFCIEDIFKDFIQTLNIAAIEQYKKDKEGYEKSKQNNN